MSNELGKAFWNNWDQVELEQDEGVPGSESAIERDWAKVLQDASLYWVFLKVVDQPPDLESSEVEVKKGWGLLKYIFLGPHPGLLNQISHFKQAPSTHPFSHSMLRILGLKIRKKIYTL